MAMFAIDRFLPQRSYAGLSVISIIAASLLLAATLAVMLVREQNYRSQQIEQVKVQAAILAATVGAALAFDDRRAAQEYVNALATSPYLQAAAVYDVRGDSVAGFARPGVVPLGLKVDPAAEKLDGYDVIVTIPVKQADTQLGFVSLRAAIEFAERLRARFLVILALTGLTALVIVALVLGQLSLRRVNRNLEAQAGELAVTVTKLHNEMSERGKAEEALRQSQKMEAIGQLAGGIAHDFNNLISIVRGNLHLLKKHVGQGGSQYLTATDQTLTRAANLTHRILAYSRRQPLQLKSVDVSALIEGMRDLLKHSVNEHVSIELRLDSDWTVLCDVNQMENVILNLAINAGDAMPDGGVLAITTANRTVKPPVDGFATDPAGDFVEIAVRDTGTGMDAATLARATDPYFTTKPMGRGTGLGLSTVFGYVRQSQGHLSIRSAPNSGTTVAILLPHHGAEA